MITVKLGGAWRHYSTVAPAHAAVLGTVTRDGIDSGALVRIEATGIYCQLNASTLRSLPQMEVAAAIAAAREGQHGGAGRGQGRKPADGKRGTRRQVVSADESAAVLRAYGDGDLSVGIRRASVLVEEELARRAIGEEG